MAKFWDIWWWVIELVHSKSQPTALRSKATTMMPAVGWPWATEARNGPTQQAKADSATEVVHHQRVAEIHIFVDDASDQCFQENTTLRRTLPVCGKY